MSVKLRVTYNNSPQKTNSNTYREFLKDLSMVRPVKTSDVANKYLNVRCE